MSNFLQSSNPALRDDAFEAFPSSAIPDNNVTTMNGVVNKTGILVTIAVVGGAIGYSLLQTMGTSIILVSSIAGLLLCFGFGFVMCGKPALAKVLGPIYAVVEGIFLGALTALMDTILESKGIKIGGTVGLQAFVVTLCCVGGMLGLYRAGILKPTRMFRAVIMTATAGIFLAYLVSFILSLAFNFSMPLISFGAAVNETGTMGLVGLGVNVLILLLASLWLIIDFGQVEHHVNARSPKEMEWFLAFGLLVTLAWIYYEALKLVVRLAVLFNNND